MNNYLFKAGFVLLLGALLTGCEVINPEEEQPSYIRIESPEFNAGTYGSSAHEITSGWVYYNGRIIGLFDLPVTLPILNEGTTRVRVEPGVIADGQRAIRTNYEFYTNQNDTLEVQRGQSYTIQPKFQFRNTVQQLVYEDFEGLQGAFGVNAPYTIEAKPNVPTDSLYFPDGGGSYGFVLSRPDTSTEIRITSTLNQMNLLQAGRPVFAEFNIRSNMGVLVGLEVTRNGEFLGTYAELEIFPTNSWKKFYVNLVREANQFQDPTATYKLVLVATPNRFGDDYIAIDNIRLIQLP